MNRANPKVLYVDDEQENLLVFRSTFRRYFDVLTANSAGEAGKMLMDQDVDVIISDQRMPDMSGVDFLKSLPENKKNIRIIMTGYSDIEAVVDALNSGKIYKYIPKPWEKESLIDIITDAIHHLEGNNESSDISGATSKAGIAPSKQSSDELVQLKKQVEDAYKNVQLLGEIGQDISSTLDMNSILNAVYENVNQLMDAYTFGIGIYNQENKTIDYQLAIENGIRFKPYSRNIEDKNQFPVWCIENKKEIFINDVENEYQLYLKDFLLDKQVQADLEDGSKWVMAYSMIYMPLMVKEKLIGLITVQSTEKNAYNEYHLNTLRNIAIYVATALENAKAYKEIEEQKEEIEHQKSDLEQKVYERTEQLRQQKDELEETFSKLKLLTEIGKEITSTLHLDTILNTIYKNVNKLMDATIFGIGIFNEKENSIYYQLAVENGKRYQPYSRSMEDKNQLPVWCIENKKEIFINDITKDYVHYIKVYKDKSAMVTLEEESDRDEPLSFIYIPLLFDNKPIGVLSVQSYRKYAYNHYHLDILRSLASYITTAIQNAKSFEMMTEAFEKLKSAQSKLVESEKMASLGVLTAGVAHEINNPVNFISGGIQSLDDNYTELSKLVEKLISHLRKPDDKLNKELIQEVEKLQVEELLPEMKELINSVKNGAKRTSDIVKGLRNFSRLDEDDKKLANLEEGIDSTLIILNSQLKDRIKVIKQYEGIPMLMCFPGQLNQVFMNILYNAADAIPEKGEITIHTWQENGSIKLSFKDNGSGMPEQVSMHIFEPFFTTKPVGKGTGLGLSIAYGIIEKHHGHIEVESKEGTGTTFTITLPIK